MSGGPGSEASPVFTAAPHPHVTACQISGRGVSQEPEPHRELRMHTPPSITLHPPIPPPPPHQWKKCLPGNRSPVPRRLGPPLQTSVLKGLAGDGCAGGEAGVRQGTSELGERTGGLCSWDQATEKKRELSLERLRVLTPMRNVSLEMGGTGREDSPLHPRLWPLTPLSQLGQQRVHGSLRPPGQNSMNSSRDAFEVCHIKLFHLDEGHK